MYISTIPSFSSVAKWRLKDEQELANKNLRMYAAEEQFTLLGLLTRAR